MQTLSCTLVCLFLAGCSSSNTDDPEPSDAGQDAGIDAGFDAGEDAGVDAGIDAGDSDGTAADGQDAGSDAGYDAGDQGSWEVVIYGYQIVNSYPHDQQAFTQGLVYVDGQLFEGTGLRGFSSLRRVDLETGEVLQIQNLDARYFGEGITAWQDKLLQLTYTSQTGFVYDRETFERLDTFGYATQGWGLTQDGSRLILSDGSATLYFLDPATFELVGSVDVHDPDGPVNRLNELEYIDGRVYANIWTTDFIAIIDPGSGRVTGIIDLTGLLSPQDCSNNPNALNGIAHDPVADRLFVTGKYWCKMFEIELVARRGGGRRIR